MMLISLVFLFFIFPVKCSAQLPDKLKCRKLGGSNSFHWINDDGSLKYVSSKTGVSLSSTYVNCSDDSWNALEGYPSCQFCASNATLVCEGKEVYSLPVSSSLPTTTLALYKLSGVGLISLPPKSFQNLTIGQLVIENSNLTYVSGDAFHGVNSIKSIQFSHNTMDSLSYMDYLLHGMNYLKEINLKHNGLRILSSSKSANLKNLEYVSLQGNPIHNLDVFFLKNSSLRFLDLRNVKFKVLPGQFKESGFPLLPSTLNSIDLSGAKLSLAHIKTMFKQFSGKNVTTVSFAYMNITQSLTCEHLTMSLLHIKDSIEHLSMEGIWKGAYLYLSNFENDKEKAYFESGPFKNLRELVLKNNDIVSIKDGVFFDAFPNLRSLSLAGSCFLTINADLFSGHKSLSFIDFRNTSFGKINGFNVNPLESMKNLDFSHSSFNTIDGAESILSSVENLETLSLCDCKLPPYLNISLKILTKLKHLDISGTMYPGLISALNDSFTTGNMPIEGLNLASNSLSMTDDFVPMFSSLKKLKKLDLSDNIIKEIPQGLVGPSLETLNLAQNFIGTWYSSAISPASNIKYLDLSNNLITFISSSMLEDFHSSSLVNLNNNPLLCNGRVVSIVCSPVLNMTVPQNFTLVQPQQFECYDVLTNNQLAFNQTDSCANYYTTRMSLITTQTPDSRSVINPTSATPVHITKSPFSLIYILLVVVVTCFITSMSIAFNWWRIKLRIHRYLSLRRARLLKRESEPLAKHQVQYDVFVSYSDVDRAWVLDHLLPNMEKEGDVSLCFHERDFQVGLGILENIIECMDRSHSLLLVVSSAFVQSKWCQFEMHLAQYRLIETFRDQLVLVMLEEIPRKLRPQTLHHMMMTKTYLIWPQQPCKDDATELFWRRLKRALKPTSLYNVFSTNSLDRE